MEELLQLASAWEIELALTNIGLISLYMFVVPVRRLFKSGSWLAALIMVFLWIPLALATAAYITA